MNVRRATQGVILATVLGWIAWDVYAAVAGGAGSTESEVVRSFANRHPAFPLAAGVVMGHFFWNVLPRSRWPLLRWQPPRWAATAVLPVVGLLSALLDASGHLPWVHPLAPFVIGMCVGRAAWPQRAEP